MFITKFVMQFPEYIGRKFFIAGESYAGHYIAAFSAYLIKSKMSFLDFKGCMIGNGLVNARW